MPVLNEANNLGDVLKFETPNLFSREEITVLAGSGSNRSLAVGEVIAKRTRSDINTTPDGGNTGDGSPGAVTLGTQAEAGAYALICITAATNAGTFQVLTPKGYRLPDLEVGQAYDSDHLNLTIADGAADFVVGDSFTIDISGDDKVVALDLAGVDGIQNPIGIIAAAITAPDGTDIEGVAIVRDAILADHALVWPGGISAQQQTDAIAALKGRGILVRKGV
jgi:hypothetical protein